MNRAVKLYTINGFLGSGKTTFLKNILEKNENLKIGVIQNEFGKIGIDGEIIKKDGMEMIEINRGSIYCSCLQLSFIEALKEMYDRQVEYLFVEGSGLADPSNMNEILDALDSLQSNAMDYKGAICLVDSAQFLEQLDEIETVEKQLKHSQLAILNKIDLVDKTKVDKIKSVIKEIKSDILFEEASFGKFEWNFMDKDLMELSPMNFQETINSPDNKPKTLHMTFEEVINISEFEKFINIIKKDCYRIKGFVEFDDGWKQIDAVGPKVDYKNINEEKSGSQIVFISKIGPLVIKPIFSNWEELVGVEMKVR